MSTQVEFENKEAVLGAIKDVRDDSTPTNWVIIGHHLDNPNKLAFEAKGSDGFEGFHSRLDDTKIQYALLRVTTKVDLSVTVKFVYVHYVGDKVPFAKKGKFAVVHGDVVKHFQPFHVDFEISEAREISPGLINEKVEQAAGNANYVRSADFAIGKPEFGKNQNQKEATQAAALKRPGSQDNLTKRSNDNLSKPGSRASLLPTARSNSGLFAAGTQSLDIQFSPDLLAAIAEVRNDTKQTNWVVGSFEGGDIKKPLILLEAGVGGVEAMKKHFLPDRFAYGLTRVIDIIDGHKTVKFAMITWIGNNISMVNKAKVSTFKGSINEKFSPFHVDLTVSELREVTDMIIADKVAFSSGSKSHLK